MWPGSSPRSGLSGCFSESVRPSPSSFSIGESSTSTTWRTSAIGGSSQHASLDAYQLLRFRLLARGTNDPGRLVAMVPAQRGGGAAVATIALGKECAEAGVDVLVVSARLGSSELALRLGLEDRRGLVTVLAGQDTLDTVVQRVPGSPGVSAIVAGPPRAGVSRLSTAQGLALVRSTRSRAGLVLIETPPIGASDALDLAATAREAVLVVTRKTSADVVEHALANLRVSGVQVIAAILVPKASRVPRRGSAPEPSAPSSSARSSEPLEQAGARSGWSFDELSNSSGAGSTGSSVPAERGPAGLVNGGAVTPAWGPRVHKGASAVKRPSGVPERSPAPHQVPAPQDPQLVTRAHGDADGADTPQEAAPRAQPDAARGTRSYYYLPSSPRSH
jgi:Mrp family chromosome partitioning ATPase